MPTRATVRKARTLRRTLSLPEALLWRQLRRSPDAIKFRRQHPIGPYVLDFYAPATRLAIEVDGVAHDMGNRPTRDQVRDDWLREQGLTVVRIAATDVLADPVGVAESLIALCRAGPSTPR